MILCVGTTPAVQRVMIFRQVVLDGVNRAVTTLDSAAGKSVNVAKALKTLGQRPVATGFLGGDHGAYLRSVLEAKEIEMDFVTVSARTRLCVTVVDQSSRKVTELVEESEPVRPLDFDKLLAVIRRRIPACRAVVMSGTITPGGPVDFYFQCAQLARGSGVMSVVDAQGALLLEALRAEPSLIKPNRSELAATLGRELKDEEAIKHAMRELVERGAQRVIITAGRNATLAFDGVDFWRIVPPTIATVNPIGSGDSFTAAVVGRLVDGDELGEACRWGAAAGAANALTPLAGELSREDVDRLAREVTVLRI